MVGIKLLTALDIPNSINSMITPPQHTHTPCSLTCTNYSNVITVCVTCHGHAFTVDLLSRPELWAGRTHTRCRWWPAQGSLPFRALDKSSDLGLVARVSWYSKLWPCLKHVQTEWSAGDDEKTRIQCQRWFRQVKKVSHKLPNDGDMFWETSSFSW